jgi:hypothetical protein
VSTVLKFQEQWLKYRTTAESLKKEKYLFQTRVEPYDVADPLPVLVQRVKTLGLPRKHQLGAVHDEAGEQGD